MVAVGPHPDDIELGCFGTLAMRKKRDDLLYEVILTNGGLGGNEGQRQEEAINAARILQANIYFGDFPDGALRDDFKVVDFIQSVIREAQADVVYLPAPNDRHQDHRYANLAGVSAARLVREVYEYETPSMVEPFVPKLWVDVTDAMDTKLEAIKCHASQAHKKELESEAVLGLARYRAFQGRVQGRYAEAFQIVRELR